jgi:hypothetical protein
VDRTTVYYRKEKYMSKQFKKLLSVICLLSLSTGIYGCGKVNLPVNAGLNLNNTSYNYTTSSLNNVAQGQKQLLIKFKEGVSDGYIQSFHSKYGTKTIKVISQLGVHVVSIPNGTDSNKMIDIIKKDPLISYVEINNSVSIDPIVPKYTILSSDNYTQSIGKQVEISGVYKPSRSGAIIYTDSAKISVVDKDGVVLTTISNVREGSKVSITGVIKQVKGFNLTNNIGIIPISLKTI